MSSNILMSEDLSKVICKQIGIDNTLVRRIEIHLVPGQPVTVYVTKFVTKALLDIDLSQAKVVIENEDQP